MKSNRMMWVLVVLVVTATVAITFGTLDSRSQEKNIDQAQLSPTPNNGYRDRSKYAIADYNEPLPADTRECQKRKLINGRYDNQGWVVKNPHPDDGGVGREDEKIPTPLLPVTESDLIVVGEITESHAYLSNDKQGVYTEFAIQIKKILKNDSAKTVVQDEFVTADREGGYVRYPNGQKVFYENSNRDLPQLGNEYVFFLTNDKQSPNYNILTLYELNGNAIIRLDRGRNFDEFKNATKSTFIETISNKISQLSQPPK